MTGDPVVLAEVWRSGRREGAHRGHAVVVDATGSVCQSWGDPALPMWPRSSLKPAQAAAMVRAGLDLPGPLLALAAASHSGEPFHVDGVRTVLAGAGLDDGALRTPADQPLDPVERDDRIAAGAGPEPILMNCSGKHAAMLATCVIRGWDTTTYLDPDHPLQQAIRVEAEELTGDRVSATGVDGCGAPVLGITLAGLARMASRCVTDAPSSPSRRVADAMRAHPEWVAGSRRDATALMRAVPGLLAKDGAEGVYVAALPDGTAVALKVEDGSERARVPALAAILRRVGLEADALAGLEWLTEPDVLGGGRPVGSVRAAEGLSG